MFNNVDIKQKMKDLKNKKHQKTRRSKPKKIKKKTHKHKYKSEKESSSSELDSCDDFSSHSQSESLSSSNSESQSDCSSKSSVSSSTAKRRNTPHFKFKIGEKLDHRFKVTRLMGTGTFGRVLQAKYKDHYYAIKIIKPVSKYIQSAKVEKQIIKNLNEKDKLDQYHLLRYVQSFYHYKYYCMVFQPLGKSLYDVIKMNQYEGFSLKTVQNFFKQILKSINFMHQNGYTHTDLKLQNILLERQELIPIRHRRLKQYYIPSSEKIRIIDFGGATHRSQRHSSIINTRQYRAPEVILQCCKWNQFSDIWCIGCIVAELFTGELLFPTHQDTQHLILIDKNCGNFPKWMIEKSDQQLKEVFYKNQIDKYCYKRYRDRENVRQFLTIEQIFKRQKQLKNLLMRCLEIDPRKRISCEQALNHQFFEIQYDEQ